MIKEATRLNQIDFALPIILSSENLASQPKKNMLYQFVFFSSKIGQPLTGNAKSIWCSLSSGKGSHEFSQVNVQLDTCEIDLKSCAAELKICESNLIPGQKVSLHGFRSQHFFQH